MYTCTHSMLKKGGIKSLKIICKKMIKKRSYHTEKKIFFSQGKSGNQNETSLIVNLYM